MQPRLSEENPTHPTEQTNSHKTLHKNPFIGTSVQNGEVSRVGRVETLAHQRNSPPQNWGHLGAFPTRNQKPFTGAHSASSAHSCPCL
jgi:hypothetical protein